MGEIRNTLSKAERLSNKSDISRLVNKGSYGYFSHLRYCFNGGNGLTINRIIVSVPKKLFKRAVKRNLIKRRLREAYRRQKALINFKGIDIMFIYNSKEIADFPKCMDLLNQVISELNEVFTKNMAKD